MKRFTASTIVKPSIKIRRRRLLPTAGEVVARVGQNINAAHVVARTARDLNFRVLPVSDRLGIPPEKLPDLVTVGAGDQVEAGTVLMHKKRLWRSQQIVSPVNGVIYAIQNGRIIIQERTDFLELRALVNGRVASIIPNRGVEIEVIGALAQAVWGSGKETFGKLLMVASAPDDAFSTAQLSSNTSGNILATGPIESEESIRRAEEGGVRGLVASSMPAHLHPAAVHSTLPILLTEGWGHQPMALPIFELLRQFSGREATLLGKYTPEQPVRPEILIPTDETPQANITSVRKPLALGVRARITRAPYAGQMGEIVHIYKLGHTTPVGVRAHGADLILSDGRRVFVPLANLDAII